MHVCYECKDNTMREILTLFLLRVWKKAIRGDWTPLGINKLSVSLLYWLWHDFFCFYLQKRCWRWSTGDILLEGRLLVICLGINKGSLKWLSSLWTFKAIFLKWLSSLLSQLKISVIFRVSISSLRVFYVSLQLVLTHSWNSKNSLLRILLGWGMNIPLGDSTFCISVLSKRKV